MSFDAQTAGSALGWKAFQHGGSKIVYFARLVVLARLLTPDDFGLIAISLVAIEVMARLTNLGMTPALIQHEDLSDKHYHTAWTIGLIRGAFVFVIVFVTAPFVAGLFGDERASPIIRVLALLPILEGAASIKVAELIRRLDFRTLAFVKMPAALANATVAISLAPFFGVWALVGGALAGPAAYLVLSYVFAPYRPHLDIDRQSTRALISFGRWMFSIGIIYLIGNSVLRLIVSRELGTDQLGLYYLAAKLAFLPLEIADEVIASVTFPLYARLQASKERVVRTFRSVMLATFALLVPASLLLVALAPGIVENILGARWSATVPVIRALAIVSIVYLLGEGIRPVLKGVGKPSKVALIEAVQTSLLVALAWIFIRNWGVVGAALAWIPAVVVATLIGVRFMTNIFERPFKGFGTPTLAVLAVAAVWVLLAAGFYAAFATTAGVIIATFIGFGGVAISLWSLDRRWDLGITRDLGQAFPQLGNLGASRRDPHDG
ncbi:MAG: lipopolysaccharide biosynthesis protein [Rhodothermales bacterium]|nr:lipopolysaccharide biosynthesis protein [Rhodothermales bacterium]